MGTEILVVGAGISGLACAKALVEAGKSVRVLEKSRGVGGRCATRRIGNLVVDHGLAFFHGTDAGFRASIEDACGESVVEGWPREVRGAGSPCQASAFREGDWRLGLAEGLTAYPKHLARGVDVQRETRVASIESAGDGWRVSDTAGRGWTARDLVLTAPMPQALQLLDLRNAGSREAESASALLGEIGFVTTLTTMAIYPENGPVPDWEMWYPEESGILQLISHDSSKRNRPERTVLVLQALPAWSREHRERSGAEWSAAMIEEAGRRVGDWAAAPERVQTHGWRFARVGSGGDLSGPILLSTGDGRRVGFAGDGFAPGGGVQAAWRSGRELARRMLEDR